MAKRVAICSDIKHIEHGEGSKPDFMMRVVDYYRSALSRQVGEAIRIWRREGEVNILNSKAEYDHSHIPILVVEQ